MNKCSSIRKKTGFSLLELLVVIAVVALLAALVLRSSGPRKAKIPVCLNNLRQIGLSFLMSASDHADQFPAQISVTNGGTMEFVYSKHVFPHFEILEKYGLATRYLKCPFETNRQAAVSYEALTDLNLSYFVNADASTNEAFRTILTGDRFLEVDHSSVARGLLLLSTNSALNWRQDFHSCGGSIGFADGHVEMTRDEKLTIIVRGQPIPTNRLCIP